MMGDFYPLSPTTVVPLGEATPSIPVSQLTWASSEACQRPAIEGNIQPQRAESSTKRWRPEPPDERVKSPFTAESLGNVIVHEV